MTCYEIQDSDSHNFKIFKPQQLGRGSKYLNQNELQQNSTWQLVTIFKTVYTCQLNYRYTKQYFF